jgi:hypothetical protein
MDPDLPRPAPVVPEVPADPAVGEMEVDSILPLKRHEPPAHSRSTSPSAKKTKIEGNYTTITTECQNAHTLHWLLIANGIDACTCKIFGLSAMKFQDGSLI